MAGKIRMETGAFLDAAAAVQAAAAGGGGPAAALGLGRSQGDVASALAGAAGGMASLDGLARRLLAGCAGVMRAAHGRLVEADSASASGFGQAG